MKTFFKLFMIIFISLGMMQCKEKEPEPKEKKIHYVDYKPDITVTYEDTIADKKGIPLDLYEDGVYDLMAYAYWQYFQWGIRRGPCIKSINDSLFLYLGTYHSSDLEEIIYGMPIGHQNDWHWYYETSGQEVEFIALKWHKADGIHYGWLRIRWDTDLKRLYINDYAIQNTPGKEILAGQTEAEKYYSN